MPKFLHYNATYTMKNKKLGYYRAYTHPPGGAGVLAAYTVMSSTP